MGGEEAVRAAFRQQAMWCRELGSPFTGLLCDVLALRLERGTALGRRILDWPGPPDAHHDSLPLRLAGGLHALVRRREAPALRRLYPPASLPAAEALWAALAETLEWQADRLDPWLDRAPQTNEVARSSILFPGLATVAARTGLPIALFELGSSAGLNLLADRYAYRLGGLEAGDPDSAVRLAPDWRGPPPAAAPVTIIRRRGVDLQPLDPREPERMLPYIWPDQQQRLARSTAALALAAADPPPVDRGDAADWIEQQLSPEADPGLARVLIHSIAFQYFPRPTQARIAARAARVGRAATLRAPFAWLRFETDPRHGPVPVLTLTLWPDGEERLLARASSHGHWVEWLDRS